VSTSLALYTEPVSLEDPLPESVAAVARAYRDLLDERFGERVQSVHLFGSHARGDADADSDVDVAVVIRGLTEAERTDAIDLAFRAWKISPSPRILSPLVWSEAELADRVRSERRIAHDILSEGIPV
jgi:predicted nucleotidyltransferase